MTKTALILGASGKFGGGASRAFRADGWTVRHYDRKTGDMTGAAMGADVIVNGLNPPAYHNWAENLPRITGEVLAAAKASGATVILPGNVYIFGDHPGVWDENTPARPNTVKGRLRTEMEAAYRQAADRDGVQVINLRAGDTIDPGSTDTVMATVMLKAIAKGKLTLMGKADAPHAWCYVPDWARAAVALANKRESLNAYEDVPFPGQTMSGAEIAATLEQLMGRTLKVSQFPWWLLALVSPFWELGRELREMRYLWDVPHQLSGQKLARLLPDFQPTANAEVLASTLAKQISPD